MKVTFNKYERVAGLFVLSAVVGSVLVSAGIAIKRGWFERKIPVTAVFKSAEGINNGTSVQMAGLRAGSVESVELLQDNTIKVQMAITGRFFPRIREDSVARVLRPFVIGDKVVEVTVGSNEAPAIDPNGLVKAEETVDIMDIVSGKKLAPLLNTLTGLADNLTVLAEAFSDTQRTKTFIKLFDQLQPLIQNMNTMSKEVITLSRQMTQKDNMQEVMNNMARLTSEMQKLIPALNAVAPELPRTSRRAVEGLDELVVTLKAIQKSFLLRGSVKDVREDEAKQRTPASEKSE